MKRLVFCLALILLAPAARAETSSSDPKAVAIADQVMKSLGGRERWDALEGLETMAESLDTLDLRINCLNNIGQ